MKDLLKDAARHVLGSGARVAGFVLLYVALALLLLGWRWEALGWGVCADAHYREAMGGQSSPGGAIVLPFVLALALGSIVVGCAKQGLGVLLVALLTPVLALLVGKRLVLQRALAGFYQAQGERLITAAVERLVELPQVRDLPVERLAADLDRLVTRARALPFLLRLVLRPVLKHAPKVPRAPEGGAPPLDKPQVLAALLRVGLAEVVARWLSPPRWLSFVPAAPLVAGLAWSFLGER